jgi:glycosyltransferase involved in cell wall biosynthesis
MKILYISDLDFRGCGYLRISLPLLEEINKYEDVELRVIGFHYMGQPHDYDYGIIPCGDFNDAVSISSQLYHVNWEYDWLVVAMDIPHINKISEAMRKQFPNIKIAGIYPIESGPLSETWGQYIADMDASFCISLFGTQLSQKYAPEAKWLPMGLDDQFYILSDKDKSSLREKYNIPKENFVILTVADNQERKNLSATINIVKKFQAKSGAKVTYILITREKMPIGWELRDYWYESESEVDFRIVERGMPEEELNNYYNIADVFAIFSKAEGWCMPVAEAICTHTPVVGNDHTGIKEQLELSHCGILVPNQFVHRDVWQNANRYYVDEDAAVEAILEVFHGKQFEVSDNYADQLTWENSAKVLYGELKHGKN